MLAPAFRLLREGDVNGFLSETAGVEGFEFVERVLDYSNASYTVIARELERLPAEGPALVLPDRTPASSKPRCC